MFERIAVIVIGVLFASEVALACKYPKPVMIGCAVLVGCLFLFNLVLLAKG